MNDTKTAPGSSGRRFYCGPSSWEATAGPPQQEKWFGRGSCLSPARSSDAPISRTDQPRPMICLIHRVRPRHVTRCYMSLLRGAPEVCGQQKSRINKDPAEFDWKCRLGLTSRGEHSRALMGGERAQEMNYICPHHAQETSIYFATHACKKTQAVVQPIPEPDRTRKIGEIAGLQRPKAIADVQTGPILLRKYVKSQMTRIRAGHVYFCGRRI